MIASWVRSLAGRREDSLPRFERCMRDSQRQAFHLAMRLTSNATEAEDLVQETYLRAFRFFHRYDDSLPFASWLYRIMTNVHIDMVRRKARLKTVSIEQAAEQGRTWDLPDESPSAETNLVDDVLDEPLQLGLRSMNPEFRMAVLLSDVEGLSYEEVAEIMQTSVGTVRSRIHRGRKQLREYLDRHHPGAYDPSAFAGFEEVSL